MVNFIEKNIANIVEMFSVSDENASLVSEIILFLVLFILAFLIFLVVRIFLIKIIVSTIKKTRTEWDNALLNHKVIHRIIYLIPGILLFSWKFLTPGIEGILDIVLSVYITLTIMGIILAFLNSLNSIYEKDAASAKQRPIKGIIQIIKILVVIVSLVLAVAKFIDKSPIYLLSGLGAMSAVTMLIFQDSIKGFVAGITMASNDIVRIGDWIEMPKYGADGDVIDISLTVVKVMNFDKTITSIPAYALVSDSFRNWRGMQASGGRRIKRALNIDIPSIGFCSEEDLESLGRIKLLKKYLDERGQEISDYNLQMNFDTSMPVNGRRLTNIGVFRIYVQEYLKNHPGVHQEMTLMVRQMPPSNDGLPLEIYCFANTTVWTEYENIQSDIFDHLFAAAPFFGLKVFQAPAGSDIRSLSGPGEDKL